jgi:hypothetical protein
VADREPSQLGLEEVFKHLGRPGSRASCGPCRFRRSARVSRARAGRALNVPTGPPHPSRWRPSYERLVTPSKPGGLLPLISSSTPRAGCHAGGSVPKRRRLSPALPSPQVRRSGVGLPHRAARSGEAGCARSRRQPSWQRSVDRAHPVGPARPQPPTPMPRDPATEPPDARSCDCPPKRTSRAVVVMRLRASWPTGRWWRHHSWVFPVSDLGDPQASAQPKYV